MKIFLVFLVFFSSESFKAFSQGKFLYKFDGVELNFPRKPFRDTTTFNGESKLKIVFGVDSISNYYLGIEDIINGNMPDSIDSRGRNDFFRGFVDSYIIHYRGEIISQKVITFNNLKGVQYNIKGNFGKQKISVVMWLFIKKQRMIFCQHLNLEKHDLIIKERQNTFINSLTIN